jgi:hypothetical protein
MRAATTPMRPVPDEAGRLAVHVEAQQRVQAEIALTHAIEGAMNLAIQRQHEADRVLGDGIGRIGRHARDGDAEPRAFGEVDVVETRAAQGDEADALAVQQIQHRRRRGGR